MEIVREFHQAAVCIHDLRETFQLLPLALGVFCNDKEAHTQHHAFAAAAVYRNGRSSHDDLEPVTNFTLGGWSDVSPDELLVA